MRPSCDNKSMGNFQLRERGTGVQKAVKRGEMVVGTELRRDSDEGAEGVEHF